MSDVLMETRIAAEPSPLAHAGEHERLLVIVPDRLSDLVRKGEVTERYYNPGNLFREVHILMTNDDKPDIAGVQPMVGEARLHLHNLPAARFAVGWNRALLKGWVARGPALARDIRPQLVRCHGASLNVHLAREIHRVLGTPYVVSLHTSYNYDDDITGRVRGIFERLRLWAMRPLIGPALREAALVMPVYRPIVPYLESLGVERFEVCYNVVAPNLRAKEDYKLHKPVRVLSVGRQLPGKDPTQLIEAVAQLEGVELTLIGDGSLHGALRDLVQRRGPNGRIKFISALSNAELCAQLADYDIFAVHSEYWEISKAVLEALLTGLPLVINRRLGEPVPELTPDICMLVDNSVAGYGDALRRLIADDRFREELGRGAGREAQSKWHPAITESRYVDIYRNLLSRPS